MTQTLSRATRLRRAAIATIALVTVALSASISVINAPTADAAAASDFQAGDIISDANFFNSSALSAAGVQAFLASQVAQCPASNGQPCLKDYTQSTPAVAADSYCSGASGGLKTAAQIIADSAVACGISPKVLIVMLQKEQGLVTATSPTTYAYLHAMGQGCPDTAACDTRYYGFFNQVYYSARQLRIYIAQPSWWAYQLGNNNILYNPNTSCGTKSVYIQNDATRALYIYTPYTPNAAALANLYGTGDACSTYGNRNFWRLYSDWFGSPTGYPVLGDMGARWQAIGGSSSPIGNPVADEVCSWSADNTNCYQNFDVGAISWTPATGAWETYGSIRALWASLNYERGYMGYPTSGPTNTPGRAYQKFQAGSIGWSVTNGAFVVLGAMSSRWIATGATTGPLGSPVAKESCANGGCTQAFETGLTAWTPSTGAWDVDGSLAIAWTQAGGASGSLGYPTAAALMAASGTYQTFQGGSIVSTAQGTIVVSGAINQKWLTLGAMTATGTLGAPVTAQSCDSAATPAKCVQRFERGSISWSASGAWETTGAIDAAWQGSGGLTGSLGPATQAAATGSNGTVSQVFAGGIIVSSGSGAYPVTGDIFSRWTAIGGTTGPLGSPTGPQVCGTKDNGCYQNFQNGAISWTSATGAWETYGDIRTRWAQQGYENGALGYPTGAPVNTSGRASQTFQGGSIAWAPGSGAYPVTGDIFSRWTAIGGTTGPLGSPTGPQVCGTKNNGCYQNFQNGAISWTSATGAWETYGDIRTRWAQQGYENGALGYPTGAPVTSGSTVTQRFQGGVLTVP
jgi:uncharacterized protein with LGFP repeats